MANIPERCIIPCKGLVNSITTLLHLCNTIQRSIVEVIFANVSFLSLFLGKTQKIYVFLESVPCSNAENIRLLEGQNEKIEISLDFWRIMAQFLKI